MKIIKTEKQKSTEVEEYGKNGILPEKSEKTEKPSKKNLKRNIVIVCTLFLIVGAVYFNWILFSGGGDYDPDDYVEAGKNIDGQTDVSKNEGADKTTDVNNGSSETGKSDEKSYYALAVIERSEARADELEVLSSIASSENADQDAKDAAYAAMSRIAEEIECEANIETLIKAKGFDDCVVLISDGKASVIVSKENLLESEIAQIYEIVNSQASIIPENVTLIEKSSV